MAHDRRPWDKLLMHLFADAIGCWLLFVSFVFVGSFSVNSILLLLYLPSFSYSSCLRLLGRLCFLPCFMLSLAPCAFQRDMLGILFLLSLFIASFYILLSLFIQTIISPRCLSTYLLHSFSYWHSSSSGCISINFFQCVICMVTYCAGIKEICLDK